MRTLSEIWGLFATRRFLASALPAAALALTTLHGIGAELPSHRLGELRTPGHRPLPHGTHAFVNGKVIVAPGQILDRATVVIRNGMIEAVGDEKPPADARIWDMTGRTLYAGFIDPYVTLKYAKQPGFDGNASSQALTSGNYGFFGVGSTARDPGQPGPSYEISAATPEHRAVEGLSPEDKLREELRKIGFTTAVIVPHEGIIRGQSAAIALSDVDPTEAVIQPDVFQHVAFQPNSSRDAFPGSLMGVIALVRQVLYDAQHYKADQEHWERNQAERPRPAFNPALHALQSVLSGKQTLIFEPQSALMNQRAAQVAREFGLQFAILASGEEWRRPKLAKETGAQLIVPVDFPELPKLHEEDWEQVGLDTLRRWDWASENPALLRQHGIEIALTTYGLTNRSRFRQKLRSALERGLSEADALAALTVIPARLAGLEDRLGTIARGKAANLTIVAGNYFDPDSEIEFVWIDGAPFHVASFKLDEKQSEEKSDKETKKEEEARALPRVARSPLEGRGPLAEPNGVLIRNATIWTSSDKGKIERGDMLVLQGKIKEIAVAPDEIDISELEDIWIIDASGMHLTPGLIDAHSHAMILGGVNEATLPSSAMVRISDVVNSETANIYRQLAGGLTVANLLHGSANPIGGQNCVIKLKDGAAPDDLKLKDAPEGIKFALGENVKQANWGERFTTRFPQTRMGVPTFMNNRFTAAQQYLNARNQEDEAGRRPVRRQLELDALAEIIQGERLIHCHSYRQDEILAFLRVMEKFGVQVATLQHVLEGYKVADEIAAHGAGASLFSDWWAYKFEVYDAIPYAGSLMHDRGVLVSFNSDDPDLARRMQLEAAKAVKYGGTPEEEALAFVTINPAKQLRISDRVGSLEAGKDADFVLWSKSPLDSTTVCLETWIEGKRYFDYFLAHQRTAALKKEWLQLAAKAKKGVRAKESKNEPDDDAHFFRVSLEHQHDSVLRHCDDTEH